MDPTLSTGVRPQETPGVGAAAQVPADATLLISLLLALPNSEQVNAKGKALPLLAQSE